MKTRFIAAFALAASFSFGSAANAATVFADGKEWLQVTESTNMSYNDMAALCSSATGICGAGMFLGSTSLHGWTWADTTAVASLFDSYIGTESVTLLPPYVKYAANSSFAPALLGEFDATNLSSGDYEGILGITRDLHAPNTVNMAYVYDSLTVTINDQAVIASWQFLHTSENYVGHWIYRDVSAVPIPAAAFMFAPALLGFLGFRRKAKNTLA